MVTMVTIVIMVTMVTSNLPPLHIHFCLSSLLSHESIVRGMSVPVPLDAARQSVVPVETWLLW